MHRKFFLLFSAAIFFTNNTFGQNNFELIVDTLGTASAECIQETFDGGYVFCGTNISNDAIVVKLDSLGIVEWTKSFVGPSLEGANYIEQTPDSGYIVNAVYDIGGPFAKNWLLKLNSSGDTIWTKTNSVGTGATIPQGMANLNNSVIGLTGYFQPQPNTGLSAYFISTLTNGYLLSSKFYNTSPFGTEAYAICEAGNNGFIISAAYGTSNLSSDFYLLRVNTFGDTLWTKTYNYSNSDAGRDVKHTDDNGFIISGTVWNNTTNASNIYLIKTDSIGDTLWTKLLYNTESQNVYSIQQTIDGGYIMVGLEPNSLGLFGVIYVIRTDTAGDTLWTKNFGEQITNNVGFYIMQTNDEGYIISGAGSLNGVAGAYIIKIDSLGNVSTPVGVPEINQMDLFTIYPNPSNGVFTLEIDKRLHDDAIFEAYSINHQLVHSCKLDSKSKEQIDLSFLPKGVYVVRLVTNGNSLTKKILLTN
ncbi:MAG: T9SS type A sorting domain-containing protein [Bacteroidia bacterium]|nr:T9SS type A sorting domain-containing protein [Bacteroidia bacterium]NNC85068.1 T9SS type A sorting domain-containing protein [Bacteroidia bacterium]NNM16295.1 T9SS type A sorting domain-containing protein [Bacteroidia bacterium]